MAFIPNNQVSEQDMYYRTTQLNRLGEMILNGQTISKIDQIASVCLSSGHHINVYRRYNSEYNIVLEDQHFNYLVQLDTTIRESIGNAYYLSDEEKNTFTIIGASSMKHNAAIPQFNLLDSKWSEIQDKYAGVSLSIFVSYTPIIPPNVEENDNYYSYIPEIYQSNNQTQGQQEKEKEKEQEQEQKQEQEQAPQQEYIHAQSKKRKRSDSFFMEPETLPKYNLRNKRRRID